MIDRAPSAGPRGWPPAVWRIPSIVLVFLKIAAFYNPSYGVSATAGMRPRIGGSKKWRQRRTMSLAVIFIKWADADREAARGAREAFAGRADA